MMNKHSEVYRECQKISQPRYYRQAALKELAAQPFDCMILDLSLPDISGFELLNRLDSDETLPKCPVIVYTGKELSPEENTERLKYADSVIVKGVKSPEFGIASSTWQNSWMIKSIVVMRFLPSVRLCTSRLESLMAFVN
jgi:CheY-like chemotaxis protein